MTERGSRRRLALLLPTLIAPLAWVLLYLPSVDFPFVWEDRDAIGSGTLLRPAGQTLAAFREPLHRIEERGASARQIYYRPLPVVALSLVDQQLGREPRHFRALAIAAGALSAAAFGCFAGWLFGRAGPALFAALFAALHPVGIETTVWIAGIPATFSAFFMVAALGCALAATRAASSWAAAGWGALSLASLAFGLLSKEAAAVTPLLLLATLLCVGAGRNRRAGVSMVLAQLLLVGGYVLVLRPAVLGSVLSGLPPIGGSQLTQIFTAIASWPRQLAWIFVPLRSSTSDSVRVVASFASGWLALGVGVAMASAIACFALWRAGARIAALGLAWIWITFAPTSGLLTQLHASGERYLFLPMFGAALVLADLGARWLPAGPPIWRQALAPLLAVLVLVGVAERTHARLPDWSSTQQLFETDLARDPSYREAYFVLGAEAFRSGKYAEASQRIAPLLVMDARFEGTTGYLNWLSVAELACLSSLGRQDFAGILELEARWQREFPALAQAPTFRICAGQARDGLGHPDQALAVYIAVANELGPSTPPPLFLAIARDLAVVGRREEAHRWLARARAGADAALLVQVQAVEAAISNSR